MRNTARFVREVADQQLRLWKFDTAEWPVQQAVENACGLELAPRAGFEPATLRIGSLAELYRTKIEQLAAAL